MRFLIIKIAGIGDVAMALGMIPEIRSKWPGAHIHWVAGYSVSSLIETAQGIDQITYVDDRRLLSGSIFAKVSAGLRALIALGLLRVDVLIVGHANPLYKTIAALIRAKEVRTFSRGAAHAHFPVPGRFHGFEYRRLASGVSATAPWLPARVGLKLPTLPSTVVPKLSEKVRKIVLSPSIEVNVVNERLRVRQWPLENYRKLAELLVSAGYAVVITGSNVEREYLRQAFNNLNVVNLAGELNLAELMSLYKECDAVVAHDSGPLHLAQLVGQRVIAIFGPTPSASFVDPYGPVELVRSAAKLMCSPCFDGRYLPFCSENICMSSISAEMVFDRLTDRIAT